MRASRLWFLLALPLIVWGCATQEGGETETTEVAAATPEEIRSLVVEEIHAVNDTIALSHPTTGESVNLVYSAVHESVMETPGGRQVVCVDFVGPEGTVYDVDYYVTQRDGQWFVTDVVIHTMGEEVVLSETDRARLGDVQ